MPNKEDWENMTKDELDKKARELEISGRSDMNKEELIKALEKHGGGSGSGRSGGSNRNDKDDDKGRGGNKRN